MKTYHVKVQRKDGAAMNADWYAEQLAEEKRAVVEGLGQGSMISPSRTYRHDHSFVVVTAPDEADVPALFPEYEVTAYEPPVSSAGQSTE